jgi:uncharacterized protein YxeA
MKNEIILILIIIILIGGWILYFYKDAITHKYNKSSGKVKEDISHAVKEIKEDLK